MPKSPASRFRLWHVAGVLTVAVAAVGGVAWHARTLHDELFARVERRLEGNAASSQAAVQRWIEERRYDAATIAAEVHAVAPDAPGVSVIRTSSLDRLLRRMRDGHGYMSVWVLDPSGRLLGAATPGRPEPAEIDAALAAMHDETARVSIPFATPHGTAICYALSSAHTGGVGAGALASRNVPFVVVLRSNPSGSLFPLVTSAEAAGSSDREQLVARAGNELRLLTATGDQANPYHSVPWAAAPAVLRRAISGGVAHGVYRDFDGRAVVAGARHVKGTTWAVVRLAARDEIEAAYRKELRGEAIVLGAILVALGLGVLTVARAERSRRLRDVSASEARLADALRSSLDAVIAVDEAERITLFNAAAERAYGYRASDVLGSSIEMLCPVELRDHQMAGLRAFVASDAASIVGEASERALGLRADGVVFPMEVAITKGEAGGKRICTLIVRDITERVRHQEEREQSLSLLRATLESTGDAILVVDLAGKTTTFNRKFLDIWDIADAVASRGEDEALLQRALTRLRDSQGFSDRLQALYDDPSGESYDLLEFGDGRMVERVSRPQRVGDRVVGRVWSFRDVTAREIAASALRRSEASNRMFVERSPFGICRVTPDGLFMSANPALVDMLGYASEDALLRVDLARLYVDQSERATLMRRHDAGEDSVVGHESRWRRAGGSVLPVRVSSQVVRDARGVSLHFLAYVENLAPLRDAEQALRQSEKLAAVGQFVSGVAHELNNPLAAVLLFTETLLEESTLDHERDTLVLLREQASRARAIVRDLLSFVRGARGDVATVAASEVVVHTLRSLERQAETTGSRLVLAASADLGWMHVDRVAIGQVLTNLVVNALQAAPGGTVRVHAAADGETLRVVVEDEGDGIPLDVLPRVFEPFFTTKPVGLGTGLGLSVSLGIAEHHGGTLRAENRHDGGGARMTLTLPLVAAPDPVAVIPDAPTKVTLGDRSVRRVLVVDDEPAIRRALARYFARRGWQVDEAGDGQDALDRLLAPDPAGRTEYDLVVSDLRMPGVSGAELHDRLAVERSELLDRLVFSTGDLVSHDAAAFVARTRCAVLEKPFQFATLDALIERITARAAAT